MPDNTRTELTKLIAKFLESKGWFTDSTHDREESYIELDLPDGHAYYITIKEM